MHSTKIQTRNYLTLHMKAHRSRQLSCKNSSENNLKMYNFVVDVSATAVA